MFTIIRGKKVLIKCRSLIKLLAILAVGGLIIFSLIMFIYKPIYSVTLNGEFIGYCTDKTEMQNKINTYMDEGSGENVAFVEINDLPEYKISFLKKGITTDDEGIFNKVISQGKNYYTYYALVEDDKEKIYVKTLAEAEETLKQLKDKKSANASDITIEEKYDTELAKLTTTNDAVSKLYEEKKTDSNRIMIASTNRGVTTRVSTSTKISSKKVNLGIKLIEPVKGIITGRYADISSVRSSAHTGLDIAAPAGTKISASASGTVVFAGTKGSFGKMVVISHGNGVQTYYAHCSSLLVSKGETVKQGQAIARVGKTGNATGNHLHLEIRVNGQSYNPQKYLY